MRIVNRVCSVSGGLSDLMVEMQRVEVVVYDNFVGGSNEFTTSRTLCELAVENYLFVVGTSF